MFVKILKFYKSCFYFDKNRHQEVNYVIFNKIIKFLTYFPSRVLYKLNVSADVVTLISYISIISSAFCFVLGKLYYGINLMLIFGFLDSLDGDIARLNNKKTLHGKTMDTFGADIFYLIIPVSISYYLFTYQKNLSYIFDVNLILIIGYLLSFSLIFYRIIELRNDKLFSKSKKIKKTKTNIIKRYKKNFIIYLLKNEIIRGNFFSEPGIILNCTILLYFNMFNFIFIYFIIILFYLIIRLSYLFFGSVLMYLSNN